jgi:uncharacterized protein YlaI
MSKRIVRATSSRKNAMDEARAINKSLKERNIDREAYVCRISRSYVAKRTRKGYDISKINYGICMRNR